MPVVVIDVERGKTRKTGYISLYTKLFKGGDVDLKNERLKKIEKLLYT
jgi:hypothetical protein